MKENYEVNTDGIYSVYIKPEELGDFLKKQTKLYPNRNTIVVATTNSKNKYFKDSSTTSTMVKSLIESGVDTIGTQELTGEQIHELPMELAKANIDTDYQAYGEPRYKTGMIGKVANMTKANEYNSIITKYEVLENNTYWLPFMFQNLKEMKKSLFPLNKVSLMPRIMTVLKIKEPETNFKFYSMNTHFDYNVPGIQRRQMEAFLNRLDQICKEEKLPVVITGDLNATLEENNMKYFVAELEKRGIKMIPANVNTFKGNKSDPNARQLDYVFVSKEFEIDFWKIAKNKYSDHDAIVAGISYTNEINSEKKSAVVQENINPSKIKLEKNSGQWENGYWIPDDDILTEEEKKVFQQQMEQLVIDQTTRSNQAEIQVLKHAKEELAELQAKQKQTVNEVAEETMAQGGMTR